MDVVTHKKLEGFTSNMEISALEAAIRTIVRQSSPQLALASLAGNAQSNVQLPAEFATAARTLAGRQKGNGNGSILRLNTEAW